jgi:hypothetical protein
MQLAYPDGPDTIPANKRVYVDLPQAQPVTDFLPPAPAAVGIGQCLTSADGLPAYSLRLGSAHFCHLKLKMQQVECHQRRAWVFMVDTHDAFSRASRFPPPHHPDAQAWNALQAGNRELKEKIERAFEQAGLVTFQSLLRDDLHT